MYRWFDHVAWLNIITPSALQKHSGQHDDVIYIFLTTWECLLMVSSLAQEVQ